MTSLIRTWFGTHLQGKEKRVALVKEVMMKKCQWCGEWRPDEGINQACHQSVYLIN